MTRLLSALLCALLFVSPVYAGTGTITTKDAAGATKTFDVITDGSGNFGAMGGVCDGAALAQCQAVKAASTAPLATDPAAVVTLSQNAGLGSAATPMQVSLANTGANATAVLVNQPTAASLNATVVGTGTFATQSTLAAETTKVIGTTRTVGNVGGVLDAIGQNVTAPANWLQFGCQFQTTPTTIVAANGSPCQVDNAGNLLVNVKTATGLAQGSTTSGQTGSMIMGAVTPGDPAYTTAQTAYASLDVKGHVRTVLGGGVPETISATGTTGATTATLATAAATTTYLCGFSIRANATAAATGNATVTGVITGTMNFTQWTAPNASGVGVTEEVFVPCIPASAANTSIAVVSAAPGTGGVVSVSAWGYQQ